MTEYEWLGKENQLGIDIWQKKYQQRNETFEEWLDRVSGRNKDIRQLIVEKKFLFGGRILSNRGMQNEGMNVTYSNCYVLTPPEDSIESIFECAGKLARTFSYGGGCGVDISKLAPRGAKVNNTAKETSGAISFTDLYSMVTGLIGQNGRRGALMLSISCDHPDLEEFINIKSDLNRVTKANISVRFTDEFMKCVDENKSYTLQFYREPTGETIEKTVNARDMFMKFAQMNWDYAEPGALFWDRIGGHNLLSESNEFEYAGTNPCAEEPLPAGGSCLLGSINLSEFVVDGDFDGTAFSKAVEVAVIALNEVLDEGLPLHPLQEQRDSVHDWRQIGLGIMGIADMLIKMEIEYGSSESVELCDMIGRIMAYSALKTSSQLAKTDGMYPKCVIEEVVASSYFLAHVGTSELYEEVRKYGLRNSQLLTIAPTGSLSTMLGISGGIEPIYANFYERKTESLHGKDKSYKVYTPIVKSFMEKHELTDSSELPTFFVTAQNLDYMNRIQMQSVWQRHIDASISSTLNVPNTTTVEDAYNIYIQAWKAGLKGVTIFRDGCKRAGILTLQPKEEPQSPVSKWGDVVPATDRVVGLKRKLSTGCGSLHCAAFFDPHTGKLLETYLSKGSTGGCNNFMIGLSRMISLSARAGCSIESIVDQLNSCGVCPSYAVKTATQKNTSKGSCCPIAIGNALLDMWQEIQRNVKTIQQSPVPSAEIESSDANCPDCNSELTFEGGCNICKNCGWSKCL